MAATDETMTTLKDPGLESGTFDGDELGEPMSEPAGEMEGSGVELGTTEMEDSGVVSTEGEAGFPVASGDGLETEVTEYSIEASGETSMEGDGACCDDEGSVEGSTDELVDGSTIEGSRDAEGVVDGDSAAADIEGSRDMETDGE